MAKDVRVNIVAKDKGSRVVKKFSNNTTSALKKIAGPVALGAVVVGFAKLMNDTVKLGDKFDKLNKKLGVSVETLSKMEHIANLSGVSFNLVTGSIERMQRRIGLATRGLGAAKKAFEYLNIDVEALSQLNPEEQFLQLAEATYKIEDPIKRAGLQFELFGMTAAELNKMLPGLRQKLSETASSITTQQAKTFAKYTDTMTEMKKNLDTIKFSVFGKIAEGMNQVFEASTRERNATLAETSARITEIGNALFTLTEQVADVESGKKGPSYKDWKSEDNKDLKLTRITTTIKDTKDETNLDELVKQYEEEAAIAMEFYNGQLENQGVNDATLIRMEQERIETMKQMRIDEENEIFEMLDKDYAKKEEMAEKEIELAKKKFQTQQQFLGQMGNLFGDFGSMLDRMGADSEENEKKTFKLKKAMSIAEATVKTYKAANDALAEYPGAAGIAMAAIITATGLINVATIAKTEPKYAKGGAFTNSIISSPTDFNIGEMGEAGPEAILPLTKTSSGELGVKSSGGSQQPTQINYNIMAMDSKSFVDFVRQNPQAVTTVMNEQMQRGNSALNANIRRVSR